MLGRYCLPDKKIYIMTHFVHPMELTTPALEAVHRLQKAGAILCNQSPLIRGVNDKPSVLAQLMRRCSFAGIVPYYLFQCRPALGNRAYTVPIEEGYDILGHAKAMVSGLAKRLRFVMSHSTGKLEIIGRTDEYTYFKYHRAADDKDSGRILICRSIPSLLAGRLRRDHTGLQGRSALSSLWPGIDRFIREMSRPTFCETEPHKKSKLKR